MWWGHSIPAWHHKRTGEIYVGKEIFNKCSLCKEERVKKEKKELKDNISVIVCGHEDFCPLREWEPEKDVLDT